MRSLSFALLAVLLLQGPSAAFAGQPAPVLRLDAAITAALITSPQLELLAIRAEQARLQWEEAAAMAESIPGDAVNTYEMAALRQLYPYQAFLAYSLAERAVQAARANLGVQVEAAFYAVLQAQALRDLAAMALARGEEQLVLARRAVAAGMAPARDAAEAQARLAELEAGLASAESQLAQTRLTFNRLLGRPLLAPFTLEGELALRPADGLVLGSHLEQAALLRFEVYQAERLLDLRRLDASLALSLPSRAGGSPSLPGLPGAPPDGTSWLEWLLDYLRGLEGGGRENPHTVPRALLGLREAELSVALVRDQVAFEVRLAFLKLEEAAGRARGHEQSVREAEHSLALTRLRYELGLARSGELAAAELALSQAQVRYLQAVYDHNLAWTLFHHSAGPGSRVELPGR